MKATSYNKSEIMKNAWYNFRHYFNITFSEALKMAWERAKQEKVWKEKMDSRWAEHRAKYGKQDDALNRAYSNVSFGRNDWAADRQSYRRYFRGYSRSAARV